MPAPELVADASAEGAGAGVPHRGRGRARVVTGLKCAVSAALVLWILRGASLADIGAAVQGASGPLLLLAFSLNFVGYTIAVHRWRLLLRAQNVEVRFPALLQSYMVAIFFNNFLPSTIGGDAVRAVDSWRFGAGKGAAVAVLFVDRFLGMVALTAFAAAAMLVARTVTATLSLPYLWIVAGGAGMLTVVWAIFSPGNALTRCLRRLAGHGITKRLHALSERIAAAFAPFRGRADALARALGLSLLLQTNVVLYYFVIARALGLPVPLLDFFLVVPLSLFVMMLPISINAIGIRENVFAFFLAMFGVARSEAIAFAWIAYGMLAVQGMLGGIVYAFRRAPTPARPAASVRSPVAR